MFGSKFNARSSQPTRFRTMESLERRDMMAGDVNAVLVNGVLHIEGTKDDDTIAVRTFEENGIAQIGVYYGKDEELRYSYDAIRVSAIELLAFAGNDTVDLSEMTVDCRILGGPGNNTLKGGAGNDVIIGSEGLDQIFGNGGIDYIYGRGGADEIDGGDGGDYISLDAGRKLGSIDEGDHDLEAMDYEQRVYHDLIHRYRDAFGFVVTEHESGGYHEQGDAVHSTGLAVAAAALHGHNADVRELLRVLRDQPFMYENGKLRLIRHPLVEEYLKRGDSIDPDPIRHSPVTKDGIIGVMAGLHYAYNSDGMSEETRALAREVMGKYIDFLIDNQWKTLDQYPEEYWSTVDDPRKNGDEKVFAKIFSTPHGSLEKEIGLVTKKGVEAYVLSPSDHYALQNVAAKMGFTTAHWNVFGATLATFTQVSGDRLQQVSKDSARNLAEWVGSQFDQFLKDLPSIHRGYSFHVIPGLDQTLITGSIDLDISSADRERVVSAVKDLVYELFNGVLPRFTDQATETPAEIFKQVNLIGRLADKVVDILPSWMGRDAARSLVMGSLQQAMPWISGEVLNEVFVFRVAHILAADKPDVAHLTFWPTLLELETRPEMVDLLGWSVSQLQSSVAESTDMLLFTWLDGGTDRVNKWLKKFETDPDYGNIDYAWKVESVSNEEKIAKASKSESKDFGKHRVDYLLLKGLKEHGRPEALSRRLDWIEPWRESVEEYFNDLKDQAGDAWNQLKNDAVRLAKKLVFELKVGLADTAKILRDQTGATYKEIVTGLAEVTNDFGDLANALREADANYNDIVESMWSQTDKSLTRMAKVLKSAGAEFGEITGALWGKANKNLNSMAKALEAAGANYGQIVDQLWTKSGKNLNNMAEALQESGANYTQIADELWSKAKSNVTNMAKVLDHTGADAGDIVNALWSKSGKSLKVMAATLDDLGVKYSEIINELWAESGKNLGKLAQALDHIGADYGDIVNALWAKSGKNLNKVAIALDEAGASYNEIVDELWARSGKNLNKMAEALDAAGANFSKVAKALAAKAGSKNQLKDAIRYIGGSAKDASSAVSDAWDSVSGKVGGVVSKGKTILGL